MPRVKGSGVLGPTRSVRLPRALDQWVQELLDAKPEASPSEILVGLLHGGLRLRPGYMLAHHRALTNFIRHGHTIAYGVYRRSLLDTFGSEYVEHLEKWLEADGLKAGSTN